VKNAIIQVDANPFKQWYQQHYGADVGIKKRQAKDVAAEPEEEKSTSAHVKRKLAVRLFSLRRGFCVPDLSPSPCQARAWGALRSCRHMITNSSRFDLSYLA